MRVSSLTHVISGEEDEHLALGRGVNPRSQLDLSKPLEQYTQPVHSPNIKQRHLRMW